MRAEMRGGDENIKLGQSQVQRMRKVREDRLSFL